MRPAILQLILIIHISITLIFAKTFFVYLLHFHLALALALATSVHFSHTNSKRQTENAINDDVVAAAVAFVVLEIFVTLWQALRATLRTFASRSHSRTHRRPSPEQHNVRWALFWDRNNNKNKNEPKRQTRGLARSRSVWVRLSLVKRSLRLKAKTENRNEIAAQSRNWSWLRLGESAGHPETLLAKERARERALNTLRASDDQRTSYVTLLCRLSTCQLPVANYDEDRKHSKHSQLQRS